MVSNPLKENSLRQQLESCKEDVFTSIYQVLRDAGVEDAYVSSIELSLRRTGPKCPPGTEPTQEVVERPDGSTVYQVVCK
jgi:hypothetical protein